jgi:hypothetical protein
MPAISEEPYEHKPATKSDKVEAEAEKADATVVGSVANTIEGSLEAVSEWLAALTFGETTTKDTTKDTTTTTETKDIATSTATNKWKITKFEPTPLVSSYLVAWANGPFAHLESSYTSPLSGKTKPLRIYATQDHIAQAQYALDVKALALPVYEKVFDIEYPLPKLDTLIAADFDAGAMENWGLITGRTSVYCLDPERGDIATKKYVASVQCHEVAHQWFGNITTMEWWDNLYLVGAACRPGCMDSLTHCGVERGLCDVDGRGRHSQ